MVPHNGMHGGSHAWYHITGSMGDPGYPISGSMGGFQGYHTTGSMGSPRVPQDQVHAGPNGPSKRVHGGYEGAKFNYSHIFLKIDIKNEPHLSKIDFVASALSFSPWKEIRIALKGVQVSDMHTREHVKL